MGVHAMDRIEQESPAELKRKLSKRLGLAAVLIVILLGALAGFDYLSQMEREASQPVAPVQPRIGPSITTGRPTDPVPPVDVPITPPPTLAPKEDVPAVEPPPKPEVAAQPTVAPPSPAPVSAQPVPVPAVGKPPVPKTTGAPTPGPSASPQPTSVPVPVGKPTAEVRPPVSESSPEGSSSAPVVGAPASASAATAPPTRLPSPPKAAQTSPAPRPVLSRLASGFVLQAGVFSSTERAEELKAKLVMAGVPVTIESRVQVGPFASQKEADEARKKIRDLGIDSIVIPPRAGRR